MTEDYWRRGRIVRSHWDLMTVTVDSHGLAKCHVEAEKKAAAEARALREREQKRKEASREKPVEKG